MTNFLQNHLAAATNLAAAELAEEFVKLPEDKRLWCPTETARSAMDQMAECAQFNECMAKVIQSGNWPSDFYDLFFAEKAELVAAGWEKIQPYLLESAGHVAAAIAALPDSALIDEIEMPSRRQKIAEMIFNPYWNMTYHMGQITYIASLLGVPD